jgi:two-component sensor histidine kinase
VNHRVANSLSLVSSLVNLQANAIKDQVAKDALSETQARIFAVSAVHKSLYASGDVQSVELAGYLASLLDNLEGTMRGEGFGASIVRQLAPVTISTDKAVSVGIIATELATNAFKYAYPAGVPGEVRVVLAPEADSVVLTISDDGPGWDGTGPAKGTGLGGKIIGAMCRTLGATIDYRVAGGTVASVRFKP